MSHPGSGRPRKVERPAVDEAKARRLIAAYKARVSFADLAERFQMSKQGIRDLLAREGVPSRDQVSA